MLNNFNKHTEDNHHTIGKSFMMIRGILEEILIFFFLYVTCFYVTICYVIIRNIDENFITFFLCYHLLQCNTRSSSCYKTFTVITQFYAC